MIRINLIGQRSKAKKTSGGSKLQIVVFMLLILIEGAFLFLWYEKLDSQLIAAKKRTTETQDKINDLKRVKDAWERWQRQKGDLDRQAQVFDTLRSDQMGPPLMLQYISYALSRLPDTPEFGDEMRAQELAGWNPKWDPRRVWVYSIDEKDGNLTFKGSALDHEDVAEFYRRLEASDFFQNVEPGLQMRKIHPTLQIKYVDFTVTAGLSYTAAVLELDKKPEMPHEDQPVPQGVPANTIKPAPSPAGGPGSPVGMRIDSQVESPVAMAGGVS